MNYHLNIFPNVLVSLDRKWIWSVDLLINLSMMLILSINDSLASSAYENGTIGSGTLSNSAIMIGLRVWMKLRHEMLPHLDKQSNIFIGDAAKNLTLWTGSSCTETAVFLDWLLLFLELFRIGGSRTELVNIVNFDRSSTSGRNIHVLHPLK